LLLRRSKLCAPRSRGFGGKSKAAPLIWGAFGDVANYVEPFAGSLAVLLSRPHAPRVETVNDLDAYLANFWRAVQTDPDSVARYADWPVNEADLHARHQWLVDRVEFRERMKTDPDHFDTKIAGWWVWGVCQWIGGGWCSNPEWRGQNNAGRAPRGVHAAVVARGANKTDGRRPHLSSDNGVHSRGVRARAGGAEVERKRTVIGRGGRGIARQVPDLGGDSGAAGRGIHASGLVHRRLPKSDRGTESRLQVDAIHDWMHALAVRLRRVRVCCGDWKRIVGPAVTTCIGVTGVLLDPPYGAGAGRDPDLYAREDLDVAKSVAAWAIENGANPRMRIALCGYEGEHEMPPTWRCIAWKAQGGYGNTAATNANRYRERIWLSPACLDPTKQRGLFDARTA
jgi:DNA adenine methylase